jgi:SET domain-containing protein
VQITHVETPSIPARITPFRCVIKPDTYLAKTIHNSRNTFQKHVKSKDGLAEQSFWFYIPCEAEFYSVTPGMMNLLGRRAALKNIMCYEDQSIHISLP